MNLKNSMLNESFIPNEYIPAESIDRKFYGKLTSSMVKKSEQWDTFVIREEGLGLESA